jgi:calcineurin-like phosphoesterase family protein
MKTWFISDTHFGHTNLMKHYPEGRGRFTDVQELDRYMIDCWNEVIDHKDEVFHLGDFGCSDQPYCVKVLRRLNGKKTLIPGNHDKKLLNNKEFISQWTHVAPYSYFERSFNGQEIIFSHYPIWEWRAIHYGAYHLHGHLHGKPHGIPGRILDVGVDGHNLQPLSVEDVTRYMNARPIRTHHEH